MQYEDLVKDFAARTKVNLELVRAAEKGGQIAYEVTQFINSLLGLLVFPQQEFFDKIPKPPQRVVYSCWWFNDY
jgi:hypothetical protein